MNTAGRPGGRGRGTARAEAQPAGFADTVIGGTVTDILLGEGAGERPLAGVGVIGLALLYLGLAAIGPVPAPFARAPRARPFPLLRHLLRHAADSAGRRRAHGGAVPHRGAVRRRPAAGAAGDRRPLIVAGVFTFLYRDLRLLAAGRSSPGTP
uniref:Uncharacterized protein n=1 Tax=Nonomuraea gerenzanensis TaxID=93944 RepID=A0A1M4EAU4_9ACTN|nr:hypothetical protein BN4615_P5368 [Nonomuraea gerenzanensis]